MPNHTRILRTLVLVSLLAFAGGGCAALGYDAPGPTALALYDLPAPHGAPSLGAGDALGHAVFARPSRQQAHRAPYSRETLGAADPLFAEDR